MYVQPGDNETLNKITYKNHPPPPHLLLIYLPILTIFLEPSHNNKLDIFLS